MSAQFLERNDDFNVPTDEAVHSGKVRSVYWLKPEDSRRLIEERNYPRFSRCRTCYSYRLRSFIRF